MFISRRSAIRSGVAAAAALAMSLTTPGPAAAQAPAEVAVVSDYTAPAEPVSVQQSQAFLDADQLTRDNPADLGYVWIDPATRGLVLDVATPRGAVLAAAFTAATGAQEPARTTRQVSRSRALLERIATDATQDPPSGVTIRGTEEDRPGNRIVLLVDRLGDGLPADLAARHGAAAVAVRVVPEEPALASGSRNWDLSPYFGGAAIKAPNGHSCSSGFSWYSAGVSYMLTAGHCAPEGGEVTSASGRRIGYVQSGFQETWKVAVGTEPLTGQSVKRGDLALVETFPAEYTAASVYTGPLANSVFTAPVSGKYPTRALIGQTFCVSGIFAETCGWSVDQLAKPVRLHEEITNTYGVADAVVTGKKTSGMCVKGGMSGGAVYSYRADGAVEAKGIISGGGGGVDGIGTAQNPCVVYFTDIWEAYLAFPGDIRAQRNDSVGTWRPSGTSKFHLRNSATDLYDSHTFDYGWGNGGDVPVSGDWDGDGVDTIGVWRPSTNTWYLRDSNSAGPHDLSFAFGWSNGGDVPVVGDWNGDGVDTIGVWRPSTKTWYLRDSNSAGLHDITFTSSFANSGDKPVVGDWNGDGIDTIGVWRPNTNTWYLRDSNSAGSADYSFLFGWSNGGDVPMIGDWNGDGYDTVGVWRATTSTWYLRNFNSAGPHDVSFTHGAAGDVPVTGNWDGH